MKSIYLLNYILYIALCSISHVTILFKSVSSICNGLKYNYKSQTISGYGVERTHRCQAIQMGYEAVGGLEYGDVINALYIGEWKYFYRSKGMQTSTDDICVSLVTTLPFFLQDKPLQTIFENVDELPSLSNKDLMFSAPNVYVDMGCGIGSILFAVTHMLRPNLSIGFEVQQLSANLAQRSINDFNNKPDLHVLNRDIRLFHNGSYIDDELSRIFQHKEENKSYDSISSFKRCAVAKNLFQKCDLITSNPPYLFLPEDVESKRKYSVNEDPQRRYARFAYHGDLDDYMHSASNLLSPSGRYILSYYTKDGAEVHRIAKKYQLTINFQVNVLMGSTSSTPSDRSQITVFDIGRMHPNNERVNCELTLDLRFRKGIEAVSGRYKMIRRWLNIHPKPLKSPSKAS